MTRLLLRFVLRLFFRVRWHHGERLVFSGPALIIPNHVSFLDALFLYALLPDSVCYVVNTKIAARFAFALRRVNHLTVDPLNPWALKLIIAKVKEGSPVVLFPEGRITVTGGLMKVYSGVALVALRSHATLYPVAIRGPQFSIFSRMHGKFRLRLFPRVSLYAGTPFCLALDPQLPFRVQKPKGAAQILAALQENLLQLRLREAGDKVNLFNLFLDAAALHGAGAPILTDINGTITYRRAALGAYLLGRRFDSLCPDEERIGVMLPTANAAVVTLLALWSRNRTPAIFNFSAGLQAVSDCAENAGIRTIVTARAFVEKARLQATVDALSERYRIVYLEDVRADLGGQDKLQAFADLWRRRGAVATGRDRVILFTSGSEGKPKGVVLNHRQIAANLFQAGSIIDFTPADRLLNALPIFHSFGLTAGTLLPLLEGVPVVLYPSPLHYRIIPELAYDRNATILLGTPTFLSGYGRVAHPYDFARLRLVVAGGEKLRDDVRQLWMEKFGQRILEGYGTTEASPLLSVNTPLFCRNGTVGRLLPGIEARLAPVPGIESGGVLQVKGPNIMEGYLIHGRGFVPVEDWYDCGDVVTIDADGFVTIAARLKRFAKISGEMVSLDAVEEEAARAFGPGRHAAIPFGDARKGERIVLFSEAADADRDRLRTSLVAHGVATLFLPAEVRRIDKLPLLASGKVDYLTLRRESGE